MHYVHIVPKIWILTIYLVSYVYVYNRIDLFAIKNVVYRFILFYLCYACVYQIYIFIQTHAYVSTLK